MAMQRVQMLLEPQQRRRLAELAEAQGKSVAEVTRMAIDAGLEELSRSDQRSRMLAALDAARTLRESMPMLDIEIIEDLRQMREERDHGLLNHN